MTFFPSVDDLSLSIYLSYYSPLFSSSLFSLSPLLPLFSLSSSPLSLHLLLSHTLRITALAGKLLEPKNISFFLGRRWKTLVGRTPREAVMEERERINRNGRTARAAKTPPLPAPRASGGDRGRRPVESGGDQGRRPVDSGGDRGRRKQIFYFLHQMTWRPCWLPSPSASAMYSTSMHTGPRWSHVSSWGRSHELFQRLG